MRLIKNREEAGKMLAAAIGEKGLKDAIALALPRGGAPVASIIAQSLDIPWDLLLVKKIGAPGNPEYAIGAMAEDGFPLWNNHIVAQMGLDENEKEYLAEQTFSKMQQLGENWRAERLGLNIKGKTVIVVDDGLATGFTMRAAIHYLKKKKAAKIIIAVPVASRFSIESLRDQVDEIVALHTPEHFFSVGQWYEDFEQVSTEEVTELLKQSVLPTHEEPIRILTGDHELKGILSIPPSPKGIIIFAHGSGSSYQSPRNRHVAHELNRKGLATLLFDLLTPNEAENRNNVFDMQLLSQRLLLATGWVKRETQLGHLPIGYFGASTGAGAALIAAANPTYDIYAVVSRGGRPDMAEEYLDQVEAPTLLIVGDLDYDVIKLNEFANTKLRNGHIVGIPNAGHLFEETGTMEQVIEHATDWFLKALPKDNQQVSAKVEQNEIVDAIKRLAHTVNSAEDFDPLIEKLAQSKIVMLGEATHGTEEFYKLRKIISEKLISEYGFNFIAVEGDWPDCYRLNRYIHSDNGHSAKDVMREFKRWPTWMWANEQTMDLIEWMKSENAGFFGLDVYSLYESLDLAKKYSKKLDPDLGKKLDEAYACFESFDRNEINYARSIASTHESCEEEVLSNLREILRLRLKNTGLNKNELFDFKQNAKVIHNAERYYHAMIHGGTDSWNIRDEHMLDTLDALLQFHGKDAKAIVWAHNTHVGDYHATDMLDEGYINLGGLARERYGIDAVSLVGFGTYEGEVLAGEAWGAKPKKIKLQAAAAKSYEHYFHQATQALQCSQLYLELPHHESVFNTKLGHRAVGVVYQENFEAKQRNYVPTNLGVRYDAFIFVDKTNALNMLDQASERGILPETWPVGF